MPMTGAQKACYLKKHKPEPDERAKRIKEQYGLQVERGRRRGPRGSSPGSGEGDGHLMNVKEHRWVCALCPGFEPESLVNKYAEAVRGLREPVDAISGSLASLSA